MRTTENKQSSISLERKKSPPIEEVTRPTVTTEEAAYYCNRKPQTMRIWACTENGLIRPIRVNGRLAWPVSEIKKIMGVS
ncbi:DNA-binding protein [Nitrosomonas sp. Is37]|uniref:DNA-binding protein n=1 Tax=Nitrosomonas sp. Is37 TaxID=3080535 RepID=UPI00294B0F5F|nr:DNA-binding protein [Nitrosomonas sp. Is37]MDV6345185.1 DNA-binding protein [Nitrosomonas sp. Is37]